MSKIFIMMFMAAMLGLTSCSGQVSAGANEKVTPEKMTPEKLTALIQKFDTDAKVENNSVTFTLNETELFFVYDKTVDRMRIISPVAQSGIASEEILIRMMQANYDAVLDTRYAMANGIIWTVFIHPLSSLTQEEFLSGIAQTVTAAETFGSSYTSGAIVFGGGDSNGIHEDLLKELEKATRTGKEI